MELLQLESLSIEEVKEAKIQTAKKNNRSIVDFNSFIETDQ